MPTWKEVTAVNPDHSHHYARRWKLLQAQGQDIYGEARLIDAMAERNSKILDAGCGTGRVGGYLAARGHTVVGVDVDPILIEHAAADHPLATWMVGDLSTDEISDHDFDLAVAAGNVMGFLAPDGREDALKNIFGALRPGGRLVAGFGAGRGWDFEDFLSLATEIGFNKDGVFSSWDLQIFQPHSTFLVAILRRPGSDLLG